jgi:2'-5' RNA ligase
MSKFKDYLDAHKKKYVALYFDKETIKNLRNYAKKNYFDLTQTYSGDDIEEEEFEFHTTVFYTNNEVILKNGIHEITPVEASIKSLDLLGPKNNIPALKLNDEFADIRSSFEKLGLKDEWPEWIPHITLSYKYNSIDKKVPTFKVRATHIVIRDQ